MTKKAKSTPTYPLSRYALIGGAIGLYFGWFFRPSEEEGFRLVTILLLAFLVAVVMTGLYVYRQRPSLYTALIQFGATFIKTGVLLALLETRNFIYDAGGQTAVIVFTVIMGVLAGLWFAYEQNRRTVAPNKKRL
jgi:hypothetical protein